MTTASKLTSLQAPDLISRLALQIQYVPPESLPAFARKSRTHSKDQIHRIAESIRTFGFTVPVLVDEAKKVIAGNARVQAAVQLGLPQVPVVVLSHLSPDEKRAFVIAENQLATLAGWDKDVLRIEFQGLREIDLDFDLEITGFLDHQIDTIVLGGDERQPPCRIPPLPSTATSRLGDLWLLGKHRLLCAESTSPLSIAQLLDGEQVCAVFTDLPSNEQMPANRATKGQQEGCEFASPELTKEAIRPKLEQALLQISATLMPNGIAFLCADWRQIGDILDAAKQTNLNMFNLVVWDKGIGGEGDLYGFQHELIFVFRKDGTSNLGRRKPGKHDRDRPNVWSYRAVCESGAGKGQAGAGLPTTKPLSLVRDALLDCTDHGDLVLDLFSRSGTTIIAAHDAGRRVAAIDRDPLYVDRGLIRWQDHFGEEARLATTGQSFREVQSERAAESLHLVNPASGSGKAVSKQLTNNPKSARVRGPGAA